jgi:hypothetical protein
MAFCISTVKIENGAVLRQMNAVCIQRPLPIGGTRSEGHLSNQVERIAHAGICGRSLQALLSRIQRLSRNHADADIGGSDVAGAA